MQAGTMQLVQGLPYLFEHILVTQRLRTTLNGFCGTRIRQRRLGKSLFVP